MNDVSTSLPTVRRVSSSPFRTEVDIPGKFELNVTRCVYVPLVTSRVTSRVKDAIVTEPG